MDGGSHSQVESAWASGDFFLSLSDNIQESYGLTVVEAMSAGLPVIASDWNGYRDTVVDGRTGFLVRTTFPPEDTGSGLARGLALQNIDYSSYLGVLSQFTAVDIQQCSNTITALAEDTNKRAEMSRNAIKQARENYDWQIIIQRYEELARELTHRRRHYETQANRDKLSQSRNIAYPNPLNIFSKHPTSTLDEDMVVTGISDSYIDDVNVLMGFNIHNFAQPLMLDPKNMIEMLKVVNRSSIKVGDLFSAYPESDRIKVLNSVMWLYKFGVIKIVDYQ